ncbi:MAG: DUF839 domain-containing protein [Proteobacteria bacterium]|nr:DUF839 domain-containing protein [Pseudomonadota bacterium]MDA0929428.1 DUF839 domain-containing protein [Pseudomonadota bacterium]
MNRLFDKRRRFLQMGAAGLGYFLAGGLSRQAHAAEDAAFFSLARIGPLQPPDHNGIMLPAGFKSRVVARSGERPVVNSSYRWHASPDGGACFATADGGWIYVSNSEENSGQGGVGALRFNAMGEAVDAYPILQNTSRNCAGGATPWGTWLSCEEFDRGQVYECDPLGNEQAVVRPALGTFEHEAVAIDLANNCAYLTEDVRDGGLYRFVSENGLPDLSAGRLEIASVVSKSGVNTIVWLEVADPLAARDATRHQVQGAAAFNGGEGIALHENKLFFVTKGDNRVWCYDTIDQSIEVIYDAAISNNPILTGVDNVVISPAGDVLVAEDGGDMQIVILTPESEPIRPTPLLQILGQDESEICGPAFDPSYQRLYFSSQNGLTGDGTAGITYEISRNTA